MKFGPQGAHSEARKRSHVAAGEATAIASPLQTTLQQRILAMLLALVLAISMVPSNALANDDAASSDDAAVAAQNEAAENEAADESVQVAGSSESSSDENDVDANASEGENDDVPTVASNEEQQASSNEAAVAPQSTNGVAENAVSGDVAVDEQTETTIEIIGVDADGNPQTWVVPTKLSLKKGSTAADAFLELLAETDIQADYVDTEYGLLLNAITSPVDGHEVRNANDYSKYWQFFVNNAPSDFGMSGVMLDGSQTLTLAYSKYGDTPVRDDQISVNVSIVGPDENGGQSVWGSVSSVALTKASNASDALEIALNAAGLDAAITGSGDSWFLSSIKAPYGDAKELGWDAATGKFWQLFVNGVRSGTGAGQCALADGDDICVAYSAWGDAAPGLVNTTFEVIGADANGNAVRWVSAQPFTMVEGSTVADLTEAYFTDSDLTAMYTNAGSWWSLDAISSPYGNHEMLGTTQDASGNWKYWSLYVNGESSDLAGNQYTLENGDKVVWAYTTYGAAQPNPDEFVINPGAARPDYSSDWSGFGNGGNSTLVNVPTPGDAADLKWSVNLATEADKWVSIGDPIIVNGEMLVTSNSELIKIDANGTIVNRVSKGGTTSYFSRPVYADGLIICASDDGTIAAFTADTLTCVWKTKPLTVSEKGRYQANSTMTVANGCVYAEFVAGVSWSGTASAGAMVCVDVATGTVKWQNATVKGESDFGAGYYWAGACASGSDLVIGDESGSVKLIDGATGAVKSSAELRAANGSLVPCRATIVSAGTENGKEVYLAVGREPATLFKVVRDGDSLSVVSSVEFGGTSTSTPAIAGGKAFIGGTDADNVGQLAVVDIASMTVENTAKTERGAAVQASPLVSVQGDDTYVYFTANKTPGALYRYSVNDETVTSIYTPTGSNADYCTASVVADAEGNLYYSNDSGTVFALQGVEGCKVTLETGMGTAMATPVKGKKMAKPNDPVRDGYTFTGWYTNYECTTPYNFDLPVTDAFTLYAGWEKVPVVVPDGGNNNFDHNGNTNNGGSNSGMNNNGNGNGSNGGSDNGDGSNGAGASNGGMVAPSNAPLSQTSDNSSASSDEKDKASEADEKASSEKSASGDARAKSSSKSASSESGAVTTSANDGDAVADNGVPTWAYVLLAVGVVGVIGAVAWFVIARRGNPGK